MKNIKDWKAEQELAPRVRWVARWNEEPEQTLRFLTEPLVVKMHSSRMLSLVCQAEFDLVCRLCEEKKPPRETGVAVVEKDADGLPRLFSAGMERFWAPFLKEHEGAMLTQAFRIGYTQEVRRYSFEPAGTDPGEASVAPEYLDGALRLLASDELYDRHSVKFPKYGGSRRDRAKELGLWVEPEREPRDLSDVEI